MIKKLPTRSLSCAVALFSLAASSFAGTEAKEMKSVVEKVKESCITGDLGVNFVSAYFSRGILQENQGTIAQPFADLYFKLYEGDGFINKITLALGIWSSIHSEETGAIPGSTTSSWYEFDYTAGLAINFAKIFTLTTSYFEFTYPNDAFGLAPQRNINTVLALDDSGFLGPFSLKPYVTVLYNFDGITGLGQTDAWYYEVGITPGFNAGPVAVTFPLKAGFGDENFYPGDSYGFFSAGANVAVPLGFISDCYGTWTVNAGATYYNLGSATQAVNSDQDEHAFVFSGGLMVAF